ncbi:aconitate hydratase AcnA [Variovorax sp. NFACC27]|uniref:aconitate hydratase AcnA n=1 Tax=unclassified Variovorax TaxID=663243 RepID=UPI00089B692B|nr:aconitate hydratase [Variovorax sp. NFACC28]SEG70106.1 aconitate hydratase [Variovorax sp. NFACC29]SFC83284.1 aconitate hydratase [Variovorax sp. NFACC26]SFF98018.1 aconitate hydratase [Variovorax sp. NFACC27]
MKSESQIKQLALANRTVRYVSIADVPGVDQLPFSLRILLENLLRQASRGVDTQAEVEALLARRVGSGLTFYPVRVYGQDILGQVMLVDMAGIRDAVAEAGGDASLVSPKVPVDVIIDHSLQVDSWATPNARRINLEREYERNGERFAFLRWCSSSFEGVRIVPPGKGIMHQIHLEYIGKVVWTEKTAEGELAIPDTCVGTDSHTPMINGLGVLGWGVGGIEAEAVMVGKPVALALPEVVGIEVKGALREGVLPTDLVLAITQRMRDMGVVGKFVEFFGNGLEALSLGDRGMIANMAPEYGATAVYFPIDDRTMDYLRMTGREDDQLELVEAFAKAQKLWRSAQTPAPRFDTVVTLDLDEIRPCLAGPRNPEDRLDLETVPTAFLQHHQEIAGRPLDPHRAVAVKGEDFALRDGAVLIAAITSCTNTANPVNMMAAGLVAKKAVALGLKTQPWVKTSLVPGSHVTASVLEKAGLQSALDSLGFHVAGFGCTTCNGGSGPLPEALVEAIEREKLVGTAVLSGNRNFEGRIHPNVRAAYLGSPALVVVYALTGSLRVDVTTEPIGTGSNGEAVYLRDIWPTAIEVANAVDGAYAPELFREKYADLFDGGEAWNALAGERSERFPWQDKSTYVRRPPYFENLPRDAAPVQDIVGMRPLVILGDSVTTDHISPSGAISLGTPAADFLLAKGIEKRDFNNYTTRRGNHDVAVRATFANIRLRNRIVPGVEGGETKLMPEGKQMRVFEAAEEYLRRDVPLAVIAGKNYGCGSSRDWAAKGVALLGVKAVIAESFERIHRTNLVGMGVLPLQFDAGTTAESLALDGSETIDLPALALKLEVSGRIEAKVRRSDGTQISVPLTIRLDTAEDVEYWRHGGILPLVWRDYVSGASEDHVSHAAARIEPEVVGGPQHELPDAMPGSEVPSASQGATLG